MNEAEQDVLGPDVVVVEQARFLLGQDEDMSGSISEALKHRSTRIADNELFDRPVPVGASGVRPSTRPIDPALMPGSPSSA